MYTAHPAQVGMRGFGRTRFGRVHGFPRASQMRGYRAWGVPLFGALEFGGDVVHGAAEHGAVGFEARDVAVLARVDD
jgi:hypothetical protein